MSVGCILIKQKSKVTVSRGRKKRNRRLPQPNVGGKAWSCGGELQRAAQGSKPIPTFPKPPYQQILRNPMPWHWGIVLVPKQRWTPGLAQIRRGGLLPRMEREPEDIALSHSSTMNMPVALFPGGIRPPKGGFWTLALLFYSPHAHRGWLFSELPLCVCFQLLGKVDAGRVLPIPAPQP